MRSNQNRRPARSRTCRPHRAAPKPNTTASSSKHAACAPSSCSLPASTKPRSPASNGPTGPTSRVSDAQLATVEQALLKGAVANGIVGELWTLDRIALVIQQAHRGFQRVRETPHLASAFLKRTGLSVSTVS
jgi:hypothetical protein